MRTRKVLAASALFALLLCGDRASAEVDRQGIINAIKAGFATWEQVQCTDIRFEYKGELSAWTNEKQGAILVYFGTDASTWIHGQAAYFTTSGIELIAEANMNRGTIGLNAGAYGWSIGAEKNKIDIQTAVAHLLPATLGFYVGSDPAGGSLQDFIVYNKVDHALTEAHQTAAQYSYFKAGVGCTRPDEPPICGVPAAASDGGTPISNCIYHSSPSDKPSGSFYHWKTLPIPYYIYVPTNGNIPGGTPVGDGGSAGNKDSGSTGADGGVVPQDAASGQACTNSEQCPSGQVCTVEGKCVATGGGGRDDGCSMTGSGAAGSSAVPVILVLILGLLCLRKRE